MLLVIVNLTAILDSTKLQSEVAKASVFQLFVVEKSLLRAFPFYIAKLGV